MPPPIPREKALDSTLSFLSEGYTFISRRCEQLGSDVFETRIMLRKVTCALGEDAAEMFYQPGRFTRKHALPPTALRLLQDKESVLCLDGEAHRRRRAMFMAFMTPSAIGQLAVTTADLWRARLARWESMDEVVLHDEVQQILCRAVCRWAGIALEEGEAAERTREFHAMIDGAGSVGPRNWRGFLLRSKTERWARRLLEQARGGALDLPEASPAHVIATHCDADGRLLDPAVAAVELINVLRPTVAIAWYITFAALALHHYPECLSRLREEEDDEYLQAFVQEVRRFYPFIPAVGGRVREEFEWRGLPFQRGAWVLLDLYGTNHDARTWQDPEAFRPERFLKWTGNPYSFVPQGGGDHDTGHRCVGEWSTIILMKTAVRLLTSAMSYDVPQQDLRVDLSRVPAIPQSRLVLRNVRSA